MVVTIKADLCDVLEMTGRQPPLTEQYRIYRKSEPILSGSAEEKPAGIIAGSDAHVIE